MQILQLDPNKVLIIHFGQLGDVILGLAALREAANRFPNAHKAVLVGSATADVVRMTGWFDEVITLDRVLMLKSNKLWASWQILKFAKQIRNRRFDLVIDLHSLPETNILGWISGTRDRLYARREGRSIDRLSNVRPAPPAEDKEIPVSEVYLQVLQPLGVNTALQPVKITPSHDDLADVRKMIPELKDGRLTIGFNPGAGHPSRRWPIASFLELAFLLTKELNARVVIFYGPEEMDLVDELGSLSSEEMILVGGLDLTKLQAAFSTLDLLISNDTGPMHLASISGTRIVVLATDTTPGRYVPPIEHVEVVRAPTMQTIEVKAVFDAVKRLI